eukprot:COSAG01_NODE_8536_length_2749_cov_2.226038_3_plen_44_part_00
MSCRLDLLSNTDFSSSLCSSSNLDLFIFERLPFTPEPLAPSVC